MADAGPTSVDLTSGLYWRAHQWVRRRAYRGIRDALGYELPITFPSPPWTKRSAMPGALCWSRHFVQSGDSDAVEYVSTSGSVVRFCGACFRHWQEEAAFLSIGGTVTRSAARARMPRDDRVEIFRRLRKSAGMTLPEMAALLRVPVRHLTRGDAAALARAAKKLLGVRPARSRVR